MILKLMQNAKAEADKKGQKKFRCSASRKEEAAKKTEEVFDSAEYKKEDEEVWQFLQYAFQDVGINPNEFDQGLESIDDIKADMDNAYKYLKKISPNIELSAEKLTIFGQMIHLVRMIRDYNDESNSSWGKALGVNRKSDESALFDEQELFKSWKEKSVASAPTQDEKNSAKQQQNEEENREPEVDEPQSWKNRIKELESDKSYLYNKAAESQKELEKAQKEIERLKKEHEELTALRDHVYHLSQDDIEVTTASLESMKKYIAPMNIYIVGGHSNWVHKLKKEFPNWGFVKPSASNTMDTRIIKRADKVYFFTDILSHSMYWVCMNAVQEAGKPFGYIHGVNYSSLK